MRRLALGTGLGGAGVTLPPPYRVSTHLVFTGTREGMTASQAGTVELVMLDVGLSLRHGCCTGADWEAHWTWRRLHGHARRVQGHPSTLGDQVAADTVADCDWVAQPRPPLQRNLEMLGLGSQRRPYLLVAAPRGDTEELRSGTWATVRGGRKRRWPVLIVSPSGAATLETPGV